MKICLQAFFRDVSTLDITAAVASVDEDMLRSVWTELDYRIDICRVTKGSHIENLQLRYINLKICTKKHVSI
jgi:hypothetical protein